MVFLGLLAIIAGVAGALYGNSLNNDLESQVMSFLNTGAGNPGDIYMYIGIAVGVVGLILLIVGLTKRK